MNLLDIGSETQTGFLYRIDARMKVLLALITVIAVVFVGRNDTLPFTVRMAFLAILGTGIIAVLLLSRVPARSFVLRVAVVVLAFGGALALFRPFLDPGTVVAVLPLGITVTREGIEAAALLLGMIIVSSSSVLLMSATTTISAMVAGLRKLGLPAGAAALLGMTLRYLFLYFETYSRIRQAQTTRGFRLRNRRVAYTWTVQQVGNTVGTLFIRSARQGQRVYEAMASRGYHHAQLMHDERKLARTDVVFLFAGMAWILAAYVAVLSYA